MYAMSWDCFTSRYVLIFSCHVVAAMHLKATACMQMYAAAMNLA